MTRFAYELATVGVAAALSLGLVGCERSKTTKGAASAASSAPAPAPGSRTCVAQLAGNWIYTCALLTSGEARCWGETIPARVERLETEPVALKGYPSTVSRLFVDRFALCASAADGSLWCGE